MNFDQNNIFVSFNIQTWQKRLNDFEWCWMVFVCICEWCISLPISSCDLLLTWIIAMSHWLAMSQRGKRAVKRELPDRALFPWPTGFEAVGPCHHVPLGPPDTAGHALGDGKCQVTTCPVTTAMWCWQNVMAVLLLDLHIHLVALQTFMFKVRYNKWGNQNNCLRRELKSAEKCC